MNWPFLILPYKLYCMVAMKVKQRFRFLASVAEMSEEWRIKKRGSYNRNKKMRHANCEGRKNLVNL